MKLTQNPLFITYHLKRETSEPEVTCKGCREIMCLDYDVPSYIKGIIKFDKDFISVVDPNIYFRNQQSSLNNLTCILVVDHIFEYRECRTGIIIEDIDEIMNLAAGNLRNNKFSCLSTFNMNFIFDTSKKGQAEQFLSNTQKLLNMHEKRKHVLRKSSGQISDEVIRTELVEKTKFYEFDIFDVNEFLAPI